MDSSGIRHRNIGKPQNISNMDLDIVGKNRYNCLVGNYRSIDVKPYGDWEDKIYITLIDVFLIKEINYDSYSVIGRLINNKIVSLTDEEERICLYEGYILEDTKKYQKEEIIKSEGFLEFLGL
jgi:hypothetical protein